MLASEIELFDHLAQDFGAEVRLEFLAAFDQGQALQFVGEIDLVRLENAGPMTGIADPLLGRGDQMQGRVLFDRVSE